MSVIRHCSVRTFLREAKKACRGRSGGGLLGHRSGLGSGEVREGHGYNERGDGMRGKLVLVVGNEGAGMDSLQILVFFFALVLLKPFNSAMFF